MNLALVINLLGRLLALEAAMMLPCVAVALVYQDGDAPAFLWSIAILLVFCLPMIFLPKPGKAPLRSREGFVVVGLVWILFSLFGALPFMFSGVTVFFRDAFFESVSGFTTAGASVFSIVEGLPRGIVFWRSLTLWVGGMGVLILTLAVMPKMGGRSALLARAESPGPTFRKMLPKMADTARFLYLLYALMTVLVGVLLLLSGLPLYDSLIHALGTAGTGGYSNRTLSVGAYDNLAAEMIIMVFMFLFSTNFLVFFRLLQRDWRGAFRHEEVRVFYAIALVSVLLIAWNTTPHYGDIGTALRHAGFQVASIMSTTGFSTSDFDLWPEFSRILLMMLVMVGACAGSTSGGIKIVRVTLMGKSAARELGRAVRPRKVRLIKMDGQTVDEETLHGVLIFLVLYVFALMAGTLAVSLDGVDFTTSFTAAASSLSNIGPGLSMVGPMGNYGHFSPGVKYVLSLIMLLGRLEFIPLLALCHPAVWRRAH